MLGKNRGKTRQIKRVEPTLQGCIASLNEGLNATPRPLVKISHSVIPSRVGSDFSFIQFADAIELSDIADILKCTLILI